jgi:hypothetical protein
MHINMNNLLLAGGALILLAGCSMHARHAGNDTRGISAPCLSEVQGSEDGTCLQVVRISGDCRSSDAVYAEQEWLTWHYPGWVLMHQEHTSSGQGQTARVEDHLHILTRDGMEFDFCFYISPLW